MRLGASIETMNAVNAIVQGRGFDIFSIEQSYVEDVGGSLAAIKALQRRHGLPGVTADPPVKFGNVTGSYPGGDHPPRRLRLRVPAAHNLGKKLDALVLVGGSDPYFAGGGDLPPAGSADIEVVDVDMNGAYPQPKIPCFSPDNAPNVYTSTATAPRHRSGLAAAYVAFLMTQYPPISNQPALSG